MNVHAKISGKVQGVGFRFSAKQKADEIGITGWIRNNPDGTVELEAQGENKQLDQFLKDLSKGLNPAIKVQEVDQSKFESSTNFNSFKIS
ncbi:MULTISPECIES: acylphosphatase [Virgibacillus]|uniref:acylphosphatase n=2 Tax=Virgibacillus TaxID=84406 RepID=A0A024QCE1_9BACI|nr:MULTISPECIES: acylphosphatase [Virgibacillus]EQB36172.1 hypothetical protein M948_14145 [Virgibacillus sp. CM-4]MYL42041.1 acylphosphatase [Virgibacillus massiliensis]GGJ46106.1 acylphosphatase [Virgibacillus kapii]CDQ39870.1 Acylphosphatase [Virgibacillus massiliensis]